MKTAQKQCARVINGVNVDALFNTIDAVKDTPAIARFEFHAKNRWINGGHNHTTIEDFSGAQKVHALISQLDK